MKTVSRIRTRKAKPKSLLPNSVTVRPDRFISPICRSAPALKISPTVLAAEITNLHEFLRRRPDRLLFRLCLWSRLRPRCHVFHLHRGLSQGHRRFASRREIRSLSSLVTQDPVKVGKSTL